MLDVVTMVVITASVDAELMAAAVGGVW